MPDLPIDLPETSDSVIGAAGEMVSAALQTAGIYGQSEVLDVFTPILGEVGGVVFVFVALGAVASVALFGNYRTGAYILVGPVLFWWVLTDTVPASGTVWHFGERQSESNPENLLKLLKLPDNNSYFEERSPKVSRFYSIWDNLVSGVVQRTVAVLIDTQNKQDLIYVARERVMAQMLRADSTEKDLIQLLSHGLMGCCGRLVLLTHQLTENYKKKQPQELTQFRQQQHNELINTKVHFDSDLRTYMQEILRYHRIKYDDQFLTAEDQNYLIDASSLMKDGEGEANSPEVPEYVDCAEVWRYTTLAGFAAAERYMTDEVYKQQNPEIPWDEVRAYVAKALTHDQETKIQPGQAAPNFPGSALATEVIAAYIIRNTFTKGIFGDVARNLGTHQSFDPTMYKAIFGDIAYAEREIGNEKIEYFGGTVPYIQGVLLFLLSLCFPFFSIFLLMPGKLTNFAAWMTLWLWVKSWDVGFAVIYFMRDLFWHFMNRDPNAATNVENMDWERPDMIYRVMLQDDPIGNLNTYYHIISLLTLSVPFITAHLCMAAPDLYDTLKNSIDVPAIKTARRKGRATRRMLATPTGRAIAEYEARRVTNQTEWAKENPGTTADGQSRARMGDAGRKRYEDVAGKLERMRQFYSPEQMIQRNFLAAATGRKMLYDAGAAGGVIAAFVGLANERHRGPNSFHTVPGFPFFDPKESSDSLDVDMPGAYGEGEEGYDQYQGEN